MYLFISEPNDRPASLMIVSSDNIIIAALNGSGMQILKFLDSNETHSLDFNYNEESLCWITSGKLWCTKMKKPSGFYKEREIKAVQNLHSKFILLQFVLLY